MSFLMFIIVLVTSSMRLLFIVEMRLLEGGGIGFGRIPWCIPVGGFDQIWFHQLLFSSVSPILRLVGLACLLIQARTDEEFSKAWLPYFCRSGQRDTSHEEFNEEVDGWLPLLPEVALARLSGQVLADVVQRKSATTGSLDGWGWRELKVLRVAWYGELARLRILGFDRMVCWMLALP